MPDGQRCAVRLSVNLILRPWLPRGVADVQDFDRVGAQSIENPLRIAQHQDDAHIGALDHARRRAR
jgi:hypothetical protein